MLAFAVPGHVTLAVGCLDTPGRLPNCHRAGCAVLQGSLKSGEIGLGATEHGGLDDRIEEQADEPGDLAFTAIREAAASALGLDVAVGDERRTALDALPACGSRRVPLDDLGRYLHAPAENPGRLPAAPTGRVRPSSILHVSITFRRHLGLLVNSMT
jgi:hypothetical protein